MKTSTIRFAKPRPITEGRFTFESIINLTTEDGKTYTVLEWYCEETKDIKEYDVFIEQYKEFLKENFIEYISHDISKVELSSKEQEMATWLSLDKPEEYVPFNKIILKTHMEVEYVD